MVEKSPEEQDAEIINNYAKEQKLDNLNCLIDIIAKRSISQRFGIQSFYENKYKNSLLNDINPLIQGDLEKAINNLFKTPIDYDVEELKRCFGNPTENIHSLIEIIFTKDAQLIYEINRKYRSKHKKTLLQEIKDSKIEAFLKEFFLTFLNEDRLKNTSNKTDEKCKSFATKIKEELDNNKPYKINQSTLMQKLCKTNTISFAKICYYFREINQGEDIITALKKKIKDTHVSQYYKFIFNAMLHPTRYFAKKLLFLANEKNNKDEDSFIRIIINRSEIDMQEIYNNYTLELQKDKDLKNSKFQNLKNVKNLDESIDIFFKEDLAYLLKQLCHLKD